MSIYNYCNDEYGIKLRLELDKNKEELRYQCFTIGGKYRGNFEYKCKNGWVIKSHLYSCLLHCSSPKVYELQICGALGYYDNLIVIITKNEYINNAKYTANWANCTDNWRDSEQTEYKVIEQIYEKLVEALNELGNDLTDQARLFLEM